MDIANDESMQIQALFESGDFFEDESIVLFFVNDGLRRKTNCFRSKNALALSLNKPIRTCLEWLIKAKIVSFLVSSEIMLSFISGISSISSPLS